jgi:hypothetical protein
MADLTQVRQKVQQARQHVANGEWHKARTLLKGLEHPKAQALLAEVDAHIAQQKPQTGKFPLLALLGFLGVCVLAVMGGMAFLAGRADPAPVVLPTLEPTADCTPDTVRAWWGAQNIALDGFVADASSASRLMPGERLTGRLQALQAFRASFPPLPSCASTDVQGAIADLLKAMDDTIGAVERWSNGSADGTQTSIDLQNAETALRQARTRARIAAG